MKKVNENNDNNAIQKVVKDKISAEKALEKEREEELKKNVVMSVKDVFEFKHTYYDNGTFETRFYPELTTEGLLAALTALQKNIENGIEMRKQSGVKISKEDKIAINQFLPWLKRSKIDLAAHVYQSEMKKKKGEDIIRAASSGLK